MSEGRIDLVLPSDADPLVVQDRPAAPAPAPLDVILSGKELTAVRALGAVDLDGLLRIAPRRYVVPGPLARIADITAGEEISAVVTVRDVRDRPMRARRGSLLLVTVEDSSGPLTLTFFLARGHLVEYHRRFLRPGVRILVSGTAGEHRGEPQIVHPDYVVLDDGPTIDEAMRPVPVYPLRGKTTQKTMRAAFATALEHADVLTPVVPETVLRSQGLPPLAEALRLLHAPREEADAQRGLAHLRFEEAFVLQAIFAQRRAADDLTPAPALTAAGPLQSRLRERLPFTLTAGQEQVTEQIAERIARDRPTSVLLQGDVGSGKTVLALLAMLRAVDSGHQAALLAPTEVLAEQHHRTITELLGELGRAGRLDGVPEATSVRLLTGSQRTADRRRTLLDVVSGEAGLVIGTHALLTEGVEFSSLGLVVIDEQHRFGVDHRRALRRRGADGSSPHVIVMTATPIPRSAALAIVGDLDVLTLTEMPARRAGTESFLVPERLPAWEDRMWRRVAEEVRTGRQAFVVCPRIIDGEAADGAGQGAGGAGGEGAGGQTEGADPPRGVEQTLERLAADPRLAGLRLGMLHGRMSTEDKQEAMRAMSAGELDVLVATTVIEVGVDVPNASAMVICDAERFGISQLHQLRGRVGRGEHPGIVFLATTAPPESEAAEHLRAIAATRDGFELARLDLERRGVGDLVGTRQSGLHATLRHLDVLADTDVVDAARQQAARVVEHDPDLDAHPGLARAVADRLRDADPDVERT